MSEAASHSRIALKLSPRAIVLASIAVAALVAAISYRWWLPPIQRLVASSLTVEADDGGEVEKAASGHGDHGHEHAGHSEGNSLEMSEQARKNIGLRIESVKLEPFVRSISVPGMVVERPGRSVVQVTAPMTGVVTNIHAIEGEAVEPGQRLFDLRLTHEELVQLQSEFLQTAEELDVIAREIERIAKLTNNGAIAKKQLLDRQYEQQKQQVSLRSKRQALLLHGLSETQIDVILQNRELLRELTIFVPEAPGQSVDSSNGVVFQVQELQVSQGQQVNAGDALATLADHAELYIEGEAFARDETYVNLAAESKADVTAVLETEGSTAQTVRNLCILYLAGKIDPGARTLDFFVRLPNEKTRDTKLEGAHRFIAWRFRPGQRVQLQIPVERWTDKIVLPVEAVAQDGVDAYVFTPNGDHLDRLPVHVEFRDTQSVVIANDGSLFPGDKVAVNGAQQLQLALKNKAGGGIDPHAGHNH